ncbi:MAG: DJ-1/PfpI family protein [Defluviitaleaceae bacterium]|nr:DJ-1/PfpI family protein [Defluviitaleaceae bacterium]
MSKIIYAFLYDDFQATEGIVAIDMLRRQELDIKIVSTLGGEYIRASNGIVIRADIGFDEVCREDMLAAIIPGGSGADALLEHPGFCEMIVDFAGRGGLIAAICSAPTVLARLGLLNGKKAVCHTAPRHVQTLRDNGAIIDSANVVIDGNFITSLGPGTTAHFAMAILKALKGQEDVDLLTKRFLFDTKF